MEALIESKQGCNLRRIDIGTWRSDVAKQFGINRLPTLWLYHDGKQVSRDTRDVLSRVTGLD